MNKTERRRAFITRKVNFLSQAQEGNRSRDAYFTCVWLCLLDERWLTNHTRDHFTAVIARNVRKAWKKRDAKFFDDISRTIKRGTEDFNADPRRMELIHNWLH